jgi:hypothetical protein
MKPETLTSQLAASLPPSSEAPPEELDELPPLLLPEPELLPASGGGPLVLLEEHATATDAPSDAAIRPNQWLGDIRFLLVFGEPKLDHLAT